MVTIEQVVSLIPEWQGKKFTFTPLSGGLTNSNYRLNIDNLSYFVRIPGPQAELLAVDRDNEYFNSNAAAQAGVGPQVVHYLKDHKIMIMEFIEGKTLNNEDMKTRGMLQRLATSLRLLHGGPRFKSDFNMFRLVEHYLEVVRHHQVEIPANYMDYQDVLADIEKVISKRTMPTYPCHNDLVAENLIDDGKLLRVIDFEYSGNNDPCFEIGDAATEMGLDHEQVARLCEAYFGEVSHSLTARSQLLGVVSDIGWVLWTAIQNKISEIEFDFWQHMMFRWERAVRLMEADQFKNWMRDCQTSH